MPYSSLRSFPEQMKVAITGSAGFVGKNLFHNLKGDYEVYGISRRQSQTTQYKQDITGERIFEVLDEINPEVIVHSAAIASMDSCELNQNEAQKINVAGTANLASWAGENKGKLIFISTEAVYPGITNDYDENSQTDPVNFYGKTKLIAEKEVETLENFVILRPTCVFGFDKGGKNFLMQLLTAKQEKKVPYDQICNPTDVSVLVDYTRGVIEKDLRGLFVATGRETMSRAEFADLASDVFSLDKTLFKKVSVSSMGRSAPIPLNNGTNPSKILRALDYCCPSVKESLERIKSIYNL